VIEAHEKCDAESDQVFVAFNRMHLRFMKDVLLCANYLGARSSGARRRFLKASLMSRGLARGWIAGASTFKPHLHGWREWSGPLLCCLSSMGPGCAIFKLLKSYQDKSRQTVLGRETLFTP